MHRPKSPTRSSQRRLLLALPLTLPLLALPASAQTTVTPPNGTGEVVTVPGGPKRVGMPVAVVAAIDTTGNADNAKAALSAANAALNGTPGFTPLPGAEYPALGSAATAKGMAGIDWCWPFTATDYQKIGKQMKVARAMTISVTPAAGGASFDAIAELFDTKTGGLVGRGAASTPTSAAADTSLQSAVQAAVNSLGRTANFAGAVISRPNGYLTRISLGENSGVRGGARVEYLREGQTIAYGTVIDLGYGESVATFAPETAFNEISINTAVRVVNNPSAGRALPTSRQLDDRDFKQFENSFAISTAAALAVYYIFIK